MCAKKSACASVRARPTHRFLRKTKTCQDDLLPVDPHLVRVLLQVVHATLGIVDAVEGHLKRSGRTDLSTDQQPGSLALENGCVRKQLTSQHAVEMPYRRDTS